MRLPLHKAVAAQEAAVTERGRLSRRPLQIAHNTVQYTYARWIAHNTVQYTYARWVADNTVQYSQSLQRQRSQYSQSGTIMLIARKCIDEGGRNVYNRLRALYSG